MELLQYKGARKREHLGSNGKGGHTLCEYGVDKSHTIIYRFNSAGFRSEELDPTAAIKIFVCGCSYTFATGVNVEQSWPFLFKKHWAEHQRIPIESINLLNFSQGGASNDYIVRTLIEQISHTQIRPDLVIAGFTHLVRFELFDDERNIAFQFSPMSIEKQKSIKLSEDAEEWRNAAELYLVATNRDDEVARFAKNVLLLQNYCQSRQIPLLCLFFEQIYSPSDLSPSDFISRISTANTAALLDAIDLKYCAPLNAKMRVDTAANNNHPGVKSQVLIAKSLWNTFKKASLEENRYASLVEMLRDRVSSSPETLAYTFLKDGQYRAESLTLGELDTKARAIAALLQAHCNPGDRVLLVYPQSIEAIAAFLGCLYAGVVAIPAPAPEMTRLKRVLPRLEAIAADAGAKLVLTHTQVLQQRDGWQFSAHSHVEKLNRRPCLFVQYRLAGASLTPTVPHLTALPWVTTDKLPRSLAEAWHAPTLRGDTLAYLQYTSGSTSTPKGVMLDHDNLMGHLAALQQAGGYTAESVTVTWMPYFHDYGLVEGMLLPLYNGTPCYLMSPTAFIKRPLRWLKAISRYRATHSQAPNFAYAYCVRRIAPEDCADLDLSCWQAASIGAEPINPEVMDEFCAVFAGCGFQRQTFAPAYGLAEATLVVAMSRKGEEPESVELADLSGRWVSCGRVLPGTRMEIVNPETGRRCGVDEVGEIWVASAGVARGYWQRQEETDATFGAVLADTGAGGFLRTGDLGFLRAGELFVTGRLKDLIIVRGENYYPQDIEWAVERCHRLLRPDAGAAFAVEVDGEERVVVVWECEAKRVGSLETEAILAAVRSTVAEQFELPMQAVVLLKRGSIFKTSSGKIQRRACRQGFLAGQLAELARWEMGQDEGLAVDRVEGNPLLVSVMEIWQQVLEVPTVRETDNFFELGGNSLKAAMLISEIECRLRIYLPLSSLAQASTPQTLVELIRSQDESKSPLIPIRTTGCKLPFFYIGGGSVGIEQLLPHLDPERPVYGFQAIDFHESSESLTTMEAVVQYYLDALLAVHPDRPYLLGGRCFGGNVALAMAGELKRRGKTVLLVTMADSHNPVWTEEEQRDFLVRWQTEYKPQVLKKHQRLGLSCAMSDRLVKRLERHRTILKDYQPQKYLGRVVYFSAEENQELGLTQFDPMQPKGWNDWVTGEFEVVKVPGRHGTYHNPPHVEVYARKLNACLEAIES